VKKGRHRRFEEARSMKRSTSSLHRRCPECGAEGDDDHAAWCMAEQEEWEDILNGSTSREGADGEMQYDNDDLHSNGVTEQEEREL
jgi:hypothetical protein